MRAAAFDPYSNDARSTIYLTGTSRPPASGGGNVACCDIWPRPRQPNSVLLFSDADEHLAREMASCPPASAISITRQRPQPQADRIDGTLTNHSDRLARLEERPTRKDYDLVGARLTASEKRTALIVAALIVLTSGAGAAANIAKLIGGV